MVFCLRATVGAVALILTVLAGGSAAAEPGVPDPTFGTGGLATVAYPGQAAEADYLIPTVAGTVVVGSTATTVSHDGGISVTELDSRGHVLPSYGSFISSTGAAWGPVGALVEPNGRLVVAAVGTPRDRYPFRTELLGFDAQGHPDPTFGSGGRLLLAEAGRGLRLYLGTDGDLRVAGATSSSEGSLDNGLLSTTVSADGHELSASTVPLHGSDLTVESALPMADGGVLFAGRAPAAFLTRLTATGAMDSSFGTAGTVHPVAGDVTIDDVEFDPAGRILLSGAFLGNLGRSVGVPVQALLMRLAANGAVDRSFAAAGFGGGGQSELTAIATEPDGSLLALAAPNSETASPPGLVHFTASGDVDLGFGTGGSANLPRSAVTNTRLSLVGNAALFGGMKFPTTGYDNLLAVQRILLTGAGIARARAQASVKLVPEQGSVKARVRSAYRFERLAGPAVVPLVPRTVPIGDGAYYATLGSRVDAHAGALRVEGVGGSATITAGVFTLRSAAHRVAGVDLTAPGCGAASHTRARLTGHFMLTAGRTRGTNTSRSASVRIDWPCHARPRWHTLRGHLTLSRFPLQPAPGSWFVP